MEVSAYYESRCLSQMKLLYYRCRKQELQWVVYYEGNFFHRPVPKGRLNLYSLSLSGKRGSVYVYLLRSYTGLRASYLLTINVSRDALCLQRHHNS